MDRRLFLAVAALWPTAAFAAGGGEKKKSGGNSYIAVQTLLGTTRRADGRRGVLSVECGLDVPDGSLRARAEQSIPRLRSAYVSTVQSYASGLPPGFPPNADFIARALQQRTDEVLGRKGARLLVGAILVN